MRKKNIFPKKVFFIAILILILNNTLAFSNPVSNTSGESKINENKILDTSEKTTIDEIIKSKIKEIEERSNHIVELSQSSLNTINITIAVVGVTVTVMSVFGYKSSRDEKNDMKEQIKEYKAYISKSKSKLDNYSDDTKKIKLNLNNQEKQLENQTKEVKKSISTMYEKIGDFNIENENYNTALINYKNSIEFNDENNEIYYKLGREIERYGDNITVEDIDGEINEVWLENIKKALYYYDILIEKKDLRGYIGKINILEKCSYKNLRIDENGSAIYFCKKAINLCDDYITKSKLCAHLGFLYSKNKNPIAARSMYCKALEYDKYNPDANIGLSKYIIEDIDIDDVEKYKKVCSNIKNTLYYERNLYSGYIESIYFILNDLYYKCRNVTQTEILRLTDLIRILINYKNHKMNHDIHLCNENLSRYGKTSIDYNEGYRNLYRLLSSIYYENNYYYNALEIYKKILDTIEGNNYTSMVEIIQDIDKKYDICNNIGFILNNYMNECDEAIIYYNKAINYTMAQLEYYENNNLSKNPGINHGINHAKFINNLRKDILHIYVNRGDAYQCKVKNRRRISNNYSSIDYDDLNTAISNYKIAIEAYPKLISFGYEGENKNRNYIKAYYRMGQAYKILADFYYTKSDKCTSNKDLALRYYNTAKLFYKKAKSNNDIENEYLKNINSYKKHLYIIEDIDIKNIEIDLIEINEKIKD